MVRSVLRFQVVPGREADFELAFRNAGMLTRPRQIAGFVDAELSRSVEERNVYLVTARWQSAESYREWQETALADAPADALDELMDTLVDPRPGVLYEVIQGDDN